MVGGEKMNLRNPLMIALDVDTREKALSLANLLGPQVGALKVGPRLSLKYGENFIRELTQYAPVFVDNKFLDIPNTMAASVQAAFDTGATFCTVHAWSGIEALGRLADLEAKLNQMRPFQILVVTILTSFTEELLPPTMVREPVAVQVRRLTKMAWETGLRGFVCSPHEVAQLKREWPSGFFVTPGVRFGDDDRGDQKRVESPGQAVRLGASAIVVGRPIVEAADPVAAAMRFLADVGE